MSGAPIVNKWLITLSVMLPTVMEIIDTSVANVALPNIQGNLNAGTDEVSWVLTSYLVSNAIVLPMTGWLSKMFGRKRMLISCMILFTLSSFLCGISPNIETLILFRVIQGASGGILIPNSQAILMETFPPNQQGMAMGIFGVGAMMGPIIGPALGGWVTDNMSWRWIFYINIPVGIIAVIMAKFFIFDPDYLKKKEGLSIDYWGLILLTSGLGSLQVVLDKGQREDWFSSSFIIAFSLIALISLIMLIYVELKHEHPIVNLRLFKDRTFATGNYMMFMFGFCLYGSLMLIPLFLQTLMGYTATLSGFVLAPGGIATLLTMPIAGGMLEKHDGRWLIGIGLVLSAWSMFIMNGFNLETSYWIFVMPRILLGIGLGLIFVPISTIALAPISKKEMGDAAGIFNLQRNIGGGVGIAVAATLLERFSQFYQTSLVQHITVFDTAARMKFEFLKSGLVSRGVDAVTAEKGAIAIMYREVARQAAMLSYNHIFWIMGIVFLLVMPFLFLLRRTQTSGPANIH
ncbi:MAG: DHA2 family efflux MFS transporter permease subunit [Deltaproteobacteria bacterium]|nr:DHA2 family efflux MFS transporter permease subunit [Deltaproteobacteria bacterium]